MSLFPSQMIIKAHAAFSSFFLTSKASNIYFQALRVMACLNWQHWHSQVRSSLPPTKKSKAFVFYVIMTLRTSFSFSKSTLSFVIEFLQPLLTLQDTSFTILTLCKRTLEFLSEFAAKCLDFWLNLLQISYTFASMH